MSHYEASLDLAKENHEKEYSPQLQLLNTRIKIHLKLCVCDLPKRTGLNTEFKMNFMQIPEKQLNLQTNHVTIQNLTNELMNEAS